MKIERKHIIFGLIAVGISVPLAFLYLQYKKIMDYIIGFNKISIKKISSDFINFDLFLNFTNKSTLSFDIIQQDYSVYFENKFVSKLTNYSTNHINKNSTSVIGVNVGFKPNDVLKALGVNYGKLISNAKSYKITIEMRLKIKLYGLPVSFPYKYENTLGGLIELYKS